MDGGLFNYREVLAIRLDSKKKSFFFSFDGMDVARNSIFFFIIKEMHTYGKLRKHRKV